MIEHDIYVFDAFWTLIKPVDKLKNLLREQKISISKDLWTIIMTTPESVVSIIEKHIPLTIHQIQQCKFAIAQEIHEWELYDDVAKVMQILQDQWKEIHLISNLWYEYITLVNKLLSKYIPQDKMHFSCIEWQRKPNSKFYNIWSTIWKSVMMIGDRIGNDYDAPMKIWRNARIIDRENRVQHIHKIASLQEIL
jgi:FMN phosphatase YigB (HAD superfamily)